MRVIFPVLHAPVGQPRPRVTTIGGHARMYEAPKGHAIHAFKRAVTAAGYEHWKHGPQDLPFAVRILFVMPRPKAKVWKTKPMPRYMHTGRPDLDNLAKGVLDALQGDVIWKEDSQVVRLSLAKVVASGAEPPHVLIDVECGDIEEGAE